jgi:hypothetical protein
MMIDLDIIFAVLTFGCILFVLQTLVDYNKRASAIRPQLNEVLKIKDHHKEEMLKVEQVMEDAEKEALKHEVAITELETKHDELELKADHLREQISADDGFKKRR